MSWITSTAGAGGGASRSAARVLGGLVVALTWLAIQGFTFYDVIAPWTAPFWPLVPMVAVPVLVGAVGALRAGRAVGGRRIARLAAPSAGLGLYLYGTIAGAALGAGGPPGNPGSTVSYTVGDRLGNNVIFDLAVIPLVTAAIGWAAAAATARLRPRRAAGVVSVPFTAASPTGEASLNPVTTPHQVGPAIRIRSWRRTAWLLVLGAGVAAAVFRAVASGPGANP